jgi:hypothetical protein
VNTKALNSLADLICRAQEQDRTPMGIAFAIDSAGRHMPPETAAELERLRAEAESSRVDWARLSRAEQRRAELEAVLGTHRKDDQAEIERLKVRVAELEAERHVTNEALSDAAEQLRTDRDQIASLEAAQGAIPPLYVADYDSAPLTLHLTREAARAACDDVAKVDAHGCYWDWRTEEGDTDRQFWTHPDDDRPTGYTGGAVWQIEVEQPDAEADGIARRIVPVQALREPVDGEHYAAVHHSYAKGRDLPETGGA